MQNRQIAAIRPKPDRVTFPSYHDAELTIIFARRGNDYGTSFGNLRADSLPDEALHAFIRTREAMFIHQFLPDRHGIAAGRETLFNQFAVGSQALAAARESVVTSLAGFGLSGGSGSAVHPIARFCRRSFAPSPWWTNRNPCGFQVACRSLTPDPCRFLDAPQRPAQLAQRDDLLSLLFVQEIAHLAEDKSPRVQCPESSFRLASFQVTAIGRFWVTAEGRQRVPYVGARCFWGPGALDCLVFRRRVLAG